jgi:hypothetical protein
MLQSVKEQTRDQAFPKNQTPGDQVIRAGRELEILFCGRCYGCSLRRVKDRVRDQPLAGGLVFFDTQNILLDISFMKIDDRVYHGFDLALIHRA